MAKLSVKVLKLKPIKKETKFTLKLIIKPVKESVKVITSITSVIS